MCHKILFLCTGNYYRSRFAEMLFNALAAQKKLDWHADSRGLALGTSNVGPIYPGVLDHLKTLGFPVQTDPRVPARLEIIDLETADLVVAINEVEHRPFLSRQFEQWAEQTIYWDVPDLNLMTTEDAFSRIEKHVKALIRQLDNQRIASAPDVQSGDDNL